MKTLVVYYSRTGQTRKIALDIAEKLKAEIDEIQDSKNRKGFWGYLWAGADAVKKSLTEIEFSKNPEDFDLVVLGSPTWAGRMAPAIRTYLTKNNLQNCAFFCTAGGKGYGNVLSELMELNLSAKIVAKIGLSGKNIKQGFEEKLKEFTSTIKG